MFTPADKPQLDRTPAVILSPDYLKMAEKVEQMAGNEDGADKTWVWEAIEGSRRHLEMARLVKE